MANTVKYLDYEGLKVLVAQIKAGDAAALAAAKDYVGSIAGKTDKEGQAYATVLAYLEDKIADAQQQATFSGKAEDVSIADVAGKITATNVEGALAEIVGKADANATAIDTITGDSSTEGSIAKALADAKSYTDDAEKTAKEYADGVKTTVEGEIGVLTSLTTDAKSTIVAALNEVDAHADQAQSEVDALETLVGTIPAGATATTVVAYAKEVADAASGDASQVASDLADEVKRAGKAETALGERIDGVNTLIGTIVEGKTVASTIADAEQSAKDYTDEQVGALGSVLNFKGIVETEADLPTEGNKQGDVYNVKTTARGTSAEFVYITDKGWEELGDVLDLSAYDTAAQAAEKVATAKSEAIASAKTYTDGLVGTLPAEHATVKAYVDALDSAMDTRVDALEEAIGGEGSVAEMIKTAIEDLDATVSTVSESVPSPVLNITITETDGKLTGVTASVKAETFDEFGAASTAMSTLQGATTSTVKDVEDKVDAITSISDTEIDALFNPVVTE